MLKRIVRSLVTFIAIFAIYVIYARIAVPWMEPPLKATKRHLPTADDRSDAAQAATKYQRLLSNYFPKDHWSQTRPPKVIASSDETGMLVFDDWERLDAQPTAQEDGRSPALVAIKQFAALYFPTPAREGILPPRDAVILEAPQGAQLEFDDFRPERWHIGQITGGQFPGRVTIRSDMREPGREDDLYLETAELEMNSKLLYTSEPVRFRLGSNAGVGRELELRFLADEHVRPKESRLKIPGFDSLEIRRDVRLRLQLEADSLLPGAEEPSPNPSLTRRGIEETNPPVEITSNGPLVLDFVGRRATLDRDVEVRQINPSGPSDQMTCNQLDLYFSPKPASNGTAPLAAEPRRQELRGFMRLAPAILVAQGHPVVVTSPARRAEARGERIQIGLREKRVVISGGTDVMLRYGPNILRAPAIDYQHPADQSGSTLGQFRAGRGPGSLVYVRDPTNQTQTLRATWQQSVELGREQGQPVLLMEGRPLLGMVETGALEADRIKLYLRELQGDTLSGGTSVPASEDSGAKGKLRLVPDRLLATGDVIVKTAQLTCRTAELLTTFHLQPTAVASTEAGAAPTGAVTNPISVGPQHNASEQTFELDAQRMRLEVQMRGEAVLPSSAVCEGHVVLREVPLPTSSDQPLEIRGGKLTIDQLESGTAHIVLSGAGPGDAAGSKMAQLVGRGTTVLTEVVELDQRGNRLWSNGPGKATLILTRGMNGRASNSPMPVDVSWQGGLQFDGQHVLIQKSVVVAGVDDTLRCDELSAKLSAPVQLGQRVQQGAVDVAEIEGRGRVSFDHRSRDDVGLTSHERFQLERLAINQQTGALSGDGPGVIRSTRFGAGLAALTDSQASGSPQTIVAQQPASGSKLHFLRIDFQRKLVGDIYVRTLSFDGRVRTVYGPVDAWEQELDGSRLESLPPDSVVLSCDTLNINEDPLAARTAINAREAETRPLGPVQVVAQGNVHIDGQSESQGTFGALADRATYEQSKDVFLLEGGSRTPAQLWLRNNSGVEATPITAGKIRYDRATGLPKIESFHPLEITPRSLEKADLPRSAPR